MTVMALEGLITRAASRADAESVVDLLNACAVAELGAPDTKLETLLMEWSGPGRDLANDTFLVTTPEGQVVGYADIYDRVPYRIWSFGRVHPDFRGRGIGAHLIHLAETAAQRAIPRAPANARVTLSQSILHQNTAAGELLRQNGYNLVRHFWRMVIDLDSPPPAPVWPEGITVRTMMRGQDDRAVHEAIHDSFSDHWGYVAWPFEEFEHYMLGDPQFDPSLVFLAMDGNQVAGLSFCFPRIDEDPDMGWVGDLGVRRPWRRMGLGLALLQHSFGEMYRRGRKRAGLGVDTESLTGATRLYERAGMRVARQYDRYEKELRPGEELSVRALHE